MPARPLRLGLVGFGRLAQGYYVPALRTSPWPVQLVVADPVETSREAARRMLPGARAYDDYRELLQRETLDALLVASPPSTHLAVWRAAAPFKLPVFMEKPFPLSHDLERIDVTDPAWARLMVNFNRRFWPPYRKIADVVRAGGIGPVESAQLRLWVDPRPWSKVSNHRLQPGEGGALQDLGSQVLDLAAMTVGESPQLLRAQRVGEEAYRIELEFPSGARCECEFGYTGRGEESVLVSAKRGSLSLDNPNFTVHRGRSPFLRVCRRSADLAVFGYRGFFRSRSMMRYSVHMALMNFLRAVQQGARFSPGFEDALRVARCLALVERSIGAPHLARSAATEGVA